MEPEVWQTNWQDNINGDVTENVNHKYEDVMGTKIRYRQRQRYILEVYSVLGSNEDIDLDGVVPEEADVVDTVEGETNNVEGEEVKVEANDTEKN